LKTTKTCLITGASKGLGEFLVKRFWDAGYNISLVARSEEGLDKVASALPKRIGQRIVCLVCDLNVLEQVLELTTKIKANLPRLDVLINNAAIHGPIGPLWDNDYFLWQQTMQVNLLAPVLLCRAFIPWMKETGGGSIINLSGGGASAPRPNFSAYATAKAGLVRFSETLAEESKPFGVRVNCIAPGAMQTALLGEVLKKGDAAAGEREFNLAEKVFVEGGTLMENVGNLALFLASDAGKGITGKLISAVWDDWEHWPEHIDDLSSTDVYTLRRIVGRDRGFIWGDK
jgi:NAD(P)-dependent dehydrogenase (short-subunit alcohol dehydrogenase family)